MRTPSYTRRLALLMSILPFLSSTGCGDLVGNAALPPDTQSPNAYNTPEGAMGLFRGANAALQDVMQDFLIASGALTDELTWGGLGSATLSIGGEGDLTDERVLDEDAVQKDDKAHGDVLYGHLQKLRGSAMQALGTLATYAPALSPALRGEMYALRGYAEVMLAELYCSGVPLSTLDYQGDFTYKPGSTQQEVYAHALALFDSALAISSDSVNVVYLASVGKGRALLDMDSVAAAAQAVAAVPVGFQYQVPEVWNAVGSGYSFGNDASYGNFKWSVATHEGHNGVQFYSTIGAALASYDPRSAVTPSPLPVNQLGVPQFIPIKYPAGTTAPVVLASGVEAQLIVAEANLRVGGTQWLTILNTLRTDGINAPVYTRQCTNGIADNTGQVTQQGSPCPAGVVDVKWGAGTGEYLIPASVSNRTTPICPTATGSGVPCSDTISYVGLPPLADPGNASARLMLLFQERAYWLFLTGHRQGDLRRLVRNDGRSQNTVYPSGVYYGGFGTYGSDVNLPIPQAEQKNPLFHGCLDRGA